MPRSNKGRRPPRPRRQTRQTGMSAAAKRWLWIAVTAVALTGIVAVAATEGSHRPEPGTARDPEAVAEGAVLYTANCATCHGADLMGTDTGPPLLNTIYAPNHHGDESFQRAVAYGVQPHHWNFGPMAPVPGLSREEVALIVEFVRSEQEAAGILRDPSHG